MTVKVMMNYILLCREIKFQGKRGSNKSALVPRLLRRNKMSSEIIKNVLVFLHRALTSMSGTSLRLRRLSR